MARAGDRVAAAAATMADPSNGRKGLLHLAAAMGDEKNCLLLVEIGNHNVNADVQGVRPLFAAVKGKNSSAIIRILLDAHADVNIVDHNGNTPLHIVSEKGNSVIAQMLLEKGAVMNRPSETGEMPIHIAARKGNLELLQALIAHAEHGDTGIHSNMPCTPLAAAASRGHADCVQCLLDAGADPNIPDANGRFPIELAAGNDSMQCVQMIFVRMLPLPSYVEWSVDAVMFRANNDFWDAQEEEDRTVTTGWEKDFLKAVGSTLVKKKSEKEEKEDKGITCFIAGNVDKLIAVLTPLSWFALGYSYGGKKPTSTSQILKISDGFFNCLCAGSMISIPSLLLMYGFSSYYKEVAEPARIGFQICCAMTFVANAYAVFVLGIMILALERNVKEYVMWPGVLIVVSMAFIWIFFIQQPKFFIHGIKGLFARIVAKWRARAVVANFGRAELRGVRIDRP